MKKYLLMLAAAITLALPVCLSSCSDDEEEEYSMSIAELRTNLVGTWEELGYESDGEVYKEYITFDSDGSFIYSYFHGWSDRKYLKGSWNLKDEKTITLTSDNTTEDYYFSYELKTYSSGISNIFISPLFRHDLYKQ